MPKTEITEDMIFQCFAAARQAEDRAETAESFIDVEEYALVPKLQLPVSRSWSFAFWVPNQELGNQRDQRDQRVMSSLDVA